MQRSLPENMTSTLWQVTKTITKYIEELGADRDGYVLTNFPYLNNGPKDLIGNSGKGKEYAYRSYSERVMYSYADRYLFQANIRHDGSSRFAKETQMGYNSLLLCRLGTQRSKIS